MSGSRTMALVRGYVQGEREGAGTKLVHIPFHGAHWLAVSACPDLEYIEVGQVGHFEVSMATVERLGLQEAILAVYGYPRGRKGHFEFTTTQF